MRHQIAEVLLDEGLQPAAVRAGSMPATSHVLFINVLKEVCGCGWGVGVGVIISSVCVNSVFDAFMLLASEILTLSYDCVTGLRGSF